ncbi:MAG: hypothetical protein R3C11_02190 [Planctomycetaceae bacterium]
MTIYSGQDSETVEFEFDENGKATRVDREDMNKYQRAANENSTPQTAIPSSPNPQNF